MAVGVIIVAAGRSQRMGAGPPKPLLEIGGRSILARSVGAFDAVPEVEELVVVVPAELVPEAPSLVGATSRPCRFVAGGAERHESVRAGFRRLSDGVDVVLVHDAARPFVDAGVISRVLEATREAGAAVPGVRARDTVKRVHASA